MPFSGICYWKRQLPDHPGAFWWWFWCHLIPGRPKTHITVGFYVNYEDFWMAFLTAISKMWLRWIFLALVIQNGTYLIVRVRFYDAFDVIWSRVDAEWSLRSIFMWILWFFVYLKITVNIFKYHAFAIKIRPALHFSYSALIQDDYYDDFDVISSLGDPKNALRSIFMWILWFCWAHF